jgi:hypothetical protein
VYESPIKDLEKSKSEVEAPDGGKFKAATGCRNLATGEITVKASSDGESATAVSKPITPTQNISISNEVFERLELGARAAALKLEDYLAVIIDRALEAATWQAECDRLNAQVQSLTDQLAAQVQPEGTWFAKIKQEM